MKGKSAFLLLAGLSLLTSCSGNYVTEVTREELSETLKKAVSDNASLPSSISDETSAFTYRNKVKEGENWTIEVLGIDLENKSFYHSISSEEESHISYGAYEEGEEEDEVGEYVAIVSEDGGENYETLDPEDGLALYEEIRLVAETSYFASRYSALVAALTDLQTFAQHEETVDAQYEDEEEEPEVGDLYLETFGERYFVSDDSFGYGLHYALGTIDEIEEDEEGEPVYVLSEESEEEKAISYTFSKIGEKGYYLSSCSDLDEQRYESSLTFDFASPLAEE